MRICELPGLTLTIFTLPTEGMNSHGVHRRLAAEPKLGTSRWQSGPTPSKQIRRIPPGRAGFACSSKAAEAIFFLRGLFQRNAADPGCGLGNRGLAKRAVLVLRVAGKLDDVDQAALQDWETRPRSAAPVASRLRWLRANRHHKTKSASVASNHRQNSVISVI